MELIKDTGAETEESKQAPDPQKIGSGSASAPGGKNAPDQDMNQMTHGQEAYPGPRPAGETDSLSASNAPGEVDTDKQNGTIPAAADPDPGATASAEETGQDGDITEPAKNKANPWNG